MAALRAVPTTQTGGLTMVEMADLTGLSTRTVADRMRRLFRQGQIETVTVWRLALNGRQVPVPSYRLRGTA